MACYIKEVVSKTIRSGFVKSSSARTVWVQCPYCSRRRFELCSRYQYHVSLRPRVNLGIREEKDAITVYGDGKAYSKIQQELLKLDLTLKSPAVVDGFLYLFKDSEYSWEDAIKDALLLLKKAKIEINPSLV